MEPPLAAAVWGKSSPTPAPDAPPRSAGSVLSFLQRLPASLQGHMQRVQAGVAGGSGGSAHDLRRPPGRRKDSFLDRLKKVASQPALAGYGGGGGGGCGGGTLAQAADAVLGSALARPGSAGGGAAKAAAPAASQPPSLAQATYNLMARPKEGSKDD